MQSEKSSSSKKKDEKKDDRKKDDKKKDNKKKDDKKKDNKKKDDKKKGDKKKDEQQEKEDAYYCRVRRRSYLEMNSLTSSSSINTLSTSLSLGSPMDEEPSKIPTSVQHPSTSSAVFPTSPRPSEQSHIETSKLSEMVSPEKPSSATKSSPDSSKSKSPSSSSLLRITRKIFQKLSPSSSDKKKAEKEERKLQEKKEKEEATFKKMCPKYKKDYQIDDSHSKNESEQAHASSGGKMSTMQVGAKDKKLKQESNYGWDNITYDPQAPSTSSCHPDVDESGNVLQKKPKLSSNVDNTDSENDKKAQDIKYQLQIMPSTSQSPSGESSPKKISTPVSPLQSERNLSRHEASDEQTQTHKCHLKAIDEPSTSISNPMSEGCKHNTNSCCKLCCSGHTTTAESVSSDHDAMLSENQTGDQNREQNVEQNVNQQQNETSEQMDVELDNQPNVHMNVEPDKDPNDQMDVEPNN